MRDYIIIKHPGYYALWQDGYPVFTGTWPECISFAMKIGRSKDRFSAGPAHQGTIGNYRRHTSRQAIRNGVKPLGKPVSLALEVIQG